MARSQCSPTRTADCWTRELIDEGQAIVRVPPSTGPARPLPAPGSDQRCSRRRRRLRGNRLVADRRPLRPAARGRPHPGRSPLIARSQSANPRGPSEAARLVGDPPPEGFQPFHAAQADLLRRLGRTVAAAREYERAAALAATTPSVSSSSAVVGGAPAVAQRRTVFSRAGVGVGTASTRPRRTADDRRGDRRPRLRRRADQYGDLGDVPLADDFQFTGPVESFDNAAGYRAMAREAGQAVTSFKVRR